MKYEFKFVVELDEEKAQYSTDIDFPPELMDAAKTNVQVTEFSACLSEATNLLCKMVAIYRQSGT